MRPGSAVFGDDQYVVVASPHQIRDTGDSMAMILRAVDGKLLSVRPIPGAEERLGTIGRYVLVWRDGEDGNVLEMFDPCASRALWTPRTFQANSRIVVLENELAGVYEPNGRFVLVGLPDGRTIVNAKVSRGNVTDFYVFRSPEEYLVVLNGPESGVRRSNGTVSHGVHGVPGAQIRRTSVYAFDRQGNQLWDAPAVIENQFLPTNQPRDLPVLLFACMTPERGTNQQKLSVVAVDKRTGRLIRPEVLSGGTVSFRAVADPEKKTVQLQLQRDILTMTFTDKALDKVQERGGTGKTSKAVLGGLQAAAGSSIDAIPLVGPVLQLFRTSGDDVFEFDASPPLRPRPKPLSKSEAARRTQAPPKSQPATKLRGAPEQEIPSR